MVHAPLTPSDTSRLPRATTHRMTGAAITLGLAALPLAGVTIALALALSARLGVGLLPVAAAVALFALCTVVALAGLPRHHPHARVGPANTVTLARLALAAALTVPLAQASALSGDPGTAWAVLAVALLALTLDGVDGWLARRTGLASAFGARFDMEVDAVLSALLALLVWQSGAAGPWVLALGFTRYVFVAACLVLPWLAAPLPDSRARKAVCVFQIGALIACLAPVLPVAVATSLAALAAAMLAWSFGRDIVWLWRRRDARPT
jgi:phosphatidylglycerophosphate synthase